MSTQKSTVDFLLTQLEGLGNVTARAMFGEYALYCGGKLVALVADDRLYIKPSSAASAFESECEYAPPYPGAKDSLCVPEERCNDREWLEEAIRHTAEALPAPKPKKG